MKKAFTLIELLVVIAIIAILAAILFPVFAQAKQAAKKTSDLSNIKQIATAIHLYVSDYDDTTPTINGRRGGNPAPSDVDYYYCLFPYTKNIQIFISQGRRTEWDNINGSGDGCDDGFNPVKQCLGYGWNWGITSAASSGLTNGRAQSGQAGYDPQWRTNTGKNFSVIASPAEMMAAGNAADSTRYTMCANYMMQYYPAQVSSLFFGGRHNVAYLDGHAKNVGWTIGTTVLTGSDTFALPASRKNGYEYCDDPEKVDPNVGMTCREYTDLLYSAYTPINR